MLPFPRTMDSMGSDSSQSSPPARNTADPSFVALARNAACHQCRKRKRKCDGARPVCTPCRNPLRRTSNVKCTYDGPASSTIPPESDPRMEQPFQAPQNQNPREREQERLKVSEKRSRVNLVDQGDAEDSATRRKRALSGRTSIPSVPRDVPSTTNAPAEYTDLVWPDWPYDLPRPEIIEHVIGVFFDKVSMVPRMIRKRSLLANLQLPPSHSEFPARSLLHAILAITAPYLPSSATTSSSYRPVRISSTTPSSWSCFEYAPTISKIPPFGVNTDFGEWHRRKAMERLAEQAETFQKLIGSLQSHIIIAQMDLLNAKSIPFWQEAGGAVRMAIPLQLNETPNRPDNAFNRFIYLTIPGAASPLDQAERDRTWWMAWLMDRQVTTPGNWPTVLHDDEVTVELPVVQANYDSGSGILTGCQNLHSDDIFLSHPPQHSDGFVLMIKAMRLQGLIVQFFRKYARGSHSFELYTTHPQVAYLRLQIAGFRHSFPIHLRRPKPGATFDPEVLAAIWLIHAADVMLGEPTILDNWTCDLAQHSLAGIRGALSLLYDVLSTSYEITLLSQICLSQWFTCGRALCRFFEAASLAGDVQAMLVFTKEVKVFRSAIERYADRHLMAVRQLNRLDALLNAQKEAIELTPNFAYDCGQEMADPKHIPVLLPNATSSTPSASTSSQSTPDWASAWVQSSAFSYEMEMDEETPVVVDDYGAGKETGGEFRARSYQGLEEGYDQMRKNRGLDVVYKNEALCPLTL